MCGIAGAVNLDGQPIGDLAARLRLMNERIAHRGPDGSGIWVDASGCAGLAHRRLSILDLSSAGSQPMLGENGSVLVHNGEVYNYLELRRELDSSWDFRSGTDSEVILASLAVRGPSAVPRMRGMWAFAVWDPARRCLFASRDRFGIKPFYYALVGRTLYFASEIKAILPFLPSVETDADAFAEYVTFQFPIGEQTLFKGVYQLPPAHNLEIENGQVKISRYWDVQYEHDTGRSEGEFKEQLISLLRDSLDIHLRSDVPVGAYVSGGIDSSLIAILSARSSHDNREFFHGKFTQFPGYDESPYARDVATRAHGRLNEIDIKASDFERTLSKVVYHLDHPIAGPGSFPQYMVSGLAASKVKVVLGGQGGDELFGGYARYLVAYLARAIDSAVMGDDDPGVAALPLQTLAPKLSLLREYKPLLDSLMRSGGFRSLADSYFQVVNRASDMREEVKLEELPLDSLKARFRDAFEAPGVSSFAHFDKMTRFDFRFLLPALLQVEDRMGMAHGLESRVPLLDHPIVELAASMPPNIKFAGGATKHMLKATFADVLPPELLQRRDKMGFPVPLKEWFSGELHDFVRDIFSSHKAATRPFINQKKILAELDDLSAMGSFSRKLWGLLCVEVWYQTFHDRSHEDAKALAASAAA